MTIQRTEQQQQALDAEQTTHPRIVDPRTNVSHFFCRQPGEER
jgi:hypothetical protein